MTRDGTSRWLPVAGRRVHYRVAGSERDDAPWVVLSHGVCADLASWDAVVEHLAAGYRLLRYDLLGHGESDKPPGPYSMDDYVAELAALLDEEGVDRAHLVGFSFGGMVAGLLAARIPPRRLSAARCAGEQDRQHIEGGKRFRQGDGHRASPS